MSRPTIDGPAVEKAGRIEKVRAGGAAAAEPDFPLFAVVGDVELYVAKDGRTNLPMTNVTWTIPVDVAVKNYVLTYQAAGVIPIGPGDVKGNPIQLCFFRAGTHEITAVGMTSVGPGFATDIVHVYAPEVQDFSAQIGFPVAGLRPDKRWTLQLGLPLGDKAVGISFTAGVSSVGTATGTIAFLQIVKLSRYRHATDGKYRSSLNGVNVVDSNADNPNRPFYGNSVHLPGMGAARGISTSDGPGLIAVPTDTGLLVPDLEVSDEFEQFQMYLMFKPDQFNATWVPLGVMQWAWGGNTVFDPHSPTRWTDVQNEYAEANALNPFQVYFPTWMYTPADAVYVRY
jgi:hypothetical protein